MENLGKIILQIREKRGISQRQLGRGLADDVEMSRLESGAKEADCFLLEALLQRLGKTADKFELIISDQEYRIILLRTLIMEGFRQEEYESVNLLLKEYGEQSEGGKPLHRQFCQGMEALMGYMEDGDRRAALRDMETAVEITCPLWREENIVEGLLCAQEIQMLLLMLALLAGMRRDGRMDRVSAEDTDLAERKLWELMRYLEEGYTDGEERSRIYPQCTWVLAKLFCARSDFGMAWETAEKGVKCLAENGMLTVMDGLLEVQAHCREKTGKREEEAYKDQVRRAISFLYQISEEQMPENDIRSLLLTSENRELVIDRELLREMRLSQGMTQEGLSEGICAPETLLRIEGGKRKPNRKNLYKMYRKMGLEREKYYGYIQTDDFTLYEKVREVMRLLFEGNDERAEITFNEIVGKLDMEILLNKQFIETLQLMFATRKCKIDWTVAAEEASNILRYTMRDYRGIVYRTPFRLESVILNFIAMCFRHSGRAADAVGLWKQMLDKFHISKVIPQHHASPEMLIYMNYPGMLEISGDLEKSERESLKGIELTLKCQRLSMASVILANLACVYEKRNTQADAILCEKCLRNSFYLFKICGYEKKCQIVQNYYSKIYLEKLD